MYVYMYINAFNLLIYQSIIFTRGLLLENNEKIYFTMSRKLQGTNSETRREHNTLGT